MVKETVVEDEVVASGKKSKMVREFFEDDKVTPERYEQAAKSELWRESMYNERNALKNRRCWRVVDTPDGVRLIKSRYVYEIRRNWTGKIAKRKPRLVALRYQLKESVDYVCTYG